MKKTIIAGATCLILIIGLSPAANAKDGWTKVSQYISKRCDSGNLIYRFTTNTLADPTYRVVGKSTQCKRSK